MTKETTNTTPDDTTTALADTTPPDQDDTAPGQGDAGRDQDDTSKDQDDTGQDAEALADDQDEEATDSQDEEEDPDEAGNGGMEAAKWRIRAHEAERRLAEAKQQLNDFRIADLERIIMSRGIDLEKLVYFDKPIPKMLQREFTEIGDVSSWFDSKGNLTPEAEKKVRKMMQLYGGFTPGAIPGAGRTPEDKPLKIPPLLRFQMAVMSKRDGLIW